jgi:hypothetical protein
VQEAVQEAALRCDPPTLLACLHALPCLPPMPVFAVALPTCGAACGSAGSAAQVPFQRYTMRTEDGAPVFVEPTLYALALRLPLKDCLQRGVRCAPQLRSSGRAERT